MQGWSAITGTKGKSTTAALAHHLALAAGVSAHLAGNIGAPALDLLDEEPARVTVIELSSYQIADLQQGPEVVLLTNLYREHTDWHGSEQAYREEKLRILRLPGVRTVVVNGRDPALLAASQGLERRLYGVPAAWDVSGREISRGGKAAMSTADLPMAGEHNALNLCGALTALEAAGVPLPGLPQALRGLRPLPHRLETVREDEQGLWVNDSISTTPQSAIAALRELPRPRGRAYRRGTGPGAGPRRAGADARAERRVGGRRPQHRAEPRRRCQGGGRTGRTRIGGERPGRRGRQGAGDRGTGGRDPALSGCPEL